MKIISTNYKMLADLITPVGLYLKIREKYSEVLLLESSDYSSKEDSLSFICFDPLHTIQLLEGTLKIGDRVLDSFDLVNEIELFLARMDFEGDKISKRFAGLFGFSSFDVIEHFETIQLNKRKAKGLIPDLRYDFYRYVIVIDHFFNELYIIENRFPDEDSGIENIKQLVYQQDYLSFNFNQTGQEESNLQDEDFKSMVTKAKLHCQRGDVFQIVLSRRFQQTFSGDEFNVYRSLRSINPSPYLYYFDYGSFRIFGSSPEAQIKVEDGIAEIHPIAGTFRRTGDPEEDLKVANRLINDPKESAEHVMLVDLARNDLSKNTDGVEVISYKEVQYFSHVIHLVSKVTGKLLPGISAFKIFADTFPAGTLSGAPKYKAMELIDEYEPTRRSFYGGAIGMINVNGNLNHAIIIRSFLSINNTLFYQAGAGIVIDSQEESELQEVNNKLAALKTALSDAEAI